MEDNKNKEAIDINSKIRAQVEKEGIEYKLRITGTLPGLYKDGANISASAEIDIKELIQLEGVGIGIAEGLGLLMSATASQIIKDKYGFHLLEPAKVSEPGHKYDGRIGSIESFDGDEATLDMFGETITVNIKSIQNPGF